MLDLNVAVMGAVAGFTIFLGLPIARMESSGVRLRGILNSVAIGILFFLLIEVTEHAWQPVEVAFGEAVKGAPFGPGVAYFVLFSGGIAAGLLSLVWYENRYLRAAAAPNGSGEKPAPGLSAERLAWMIAVGIGLHNFSEGLAIGASAAAGVVSFAVVLAVGFALHNATEGFGIAAPLAAGPKPSWAFLGALGLIGGGPTFFGALVGALYFDPYLNVAFLSLAAGALLYVIRQLFLVGRAAAADPRHSVVIMAGVVLGLCVGFGTELIVELAGA